MIEFDDEGIQKEFNDCHFRQEYDGVDICRGMCQPCGKTIESGECEMLADYFGKKRDSCYAFRDELFKYIDNAPTININTNDIEYKAYCKGLEDGKKIVRPHGKWIDHQGLFFDCSICKYKTAYGGNYCPNCGAKMDGKGAKK